MDFVRAACLKPGRHGGGNASKHYRRALIVDDSSRTGEALAKAVEKLDTASVDLPAHHHLYVVYGTSSIRGRVDVVMEIIDKARILSGMCCIIRELQKTHASILMAFFATIPQLRRK